MSGILPFIDNFVQESMKKQHLAVSLDSDLNKACHEINASPVPLVPKKFCQTKKSFFCDPQILYVYPSKADSLDYLQKAELLVQALSGIKNTAVFELSGNEESIVCSFYAEKSDIAIIRSAVRNFYPNSFSETAEITNFVSNTIDYFVYDFVPDAPFYKSFTSYQALIVSPINQIAQILFNIEKNQTGMYQILFSPIHGGEINQMVKTAIDCEWRAMQGAENIIAPSQQVNYINKDVEYKTPDFKSYMAVAARLILPSESFAPSVRAFIANYTYGSKGMRIIDNQYYSQQQITEMLKNRVSYHPGAIYNSFELTGLLHLPFQILNDKRFNEIFAASPVGDMPNKTARYKDIAIGTWACKNSSIECRLPIQLENPHVHLCGVSRSGKSVLLSHMALEKFNRNEAVFVLDPHGDLVESILKKIPKERIDDVIVIDFGQKNLTPKITIRGNMDITNPSKVSDDLSESMRDISSGSEKFWGPKMSYSFACLYYIYCVLTDLSLADIRLLVARSPKAKAFRSKIKARIPHQIVREFLEELDFVPYESILPVVVRLSHLLLDEKSFRLFTLEENKISINDIMENGKLCLVNLSCGIIGKQRSSILSGQLDSLISNNAFGRAVIPYSMRKPVCVIKDEFYLGPGDLDSQLNQLAKYGLSVVFAHQYLNQVDGRTREVMATAGTRIIFKIRREDAEVMAQDFGISPSEFTNLRKFQAIVKIEDEVVKLNTPRPSFDTEDFSREIISNCFEKYYLRHDSWLEDEKPKLEFDLL